jgi:hypothetical protein
MSAGPSLSQKELESSDDESSRESYTSLEFMPGIKICSGGGAETSMGSVLWRAIYGQECQCYY